MQEMTIAWHEAFDAHPETRAIRFLWNVGIVMKHRNPRAKRIHPLMT